jgi:glycosyltransferase domain-containing protein
MASKGAPHITILVPTYNRSPFLRRAIRSVLRQSFSDWELVVLDDGSTDDTERIIKEFMANNPRITTIRNTRNENTGIATLLDKGLAVAKGKYIARLDDDDYWIDDNKLRKQFDFLESHPDYVAVGGGVVIVDSNEKEMSRYFKKETDAQIRANALFANPFSHTTTMFRTDAARHVGSYGANRFAEDWDLWLRMGSIGKFYNFQEYFTAYTMSGNNESFVQQKGMSRAILGYIKKHRRGYPGFLKAYLLNCAQYFYSFLPMVIRRPMQTALVSLKRRAF